MGEERDDLRQTRDVDADIWNANAGSRSGLVALRDGFGGFWAELVDGLMQGLRRKGSFEERVRWSAAGGSRHPREVRIRLQVQIDALRLPMARPQTILVWDELAFKSTRHR